MDPSPEITKKPNPSASAEQDLRREQEQLQKATKENTDRRFELWCDVQRSIRYHRAREAFFQWYASIFSFLTLMLGSGVVVSLLSSAPKGLTVFCGVAVAAMQAVELVFQVGQKARLHNGLASEFSAINRLMAKDPEMSLLQLNELSADILAIEAREPPIKRYLDLICHNQVANSIGSDDKEPLSYVQRNFAHWLSGDSAMQNTKKQSSPR